MRLIFWGTSDFARPSLERIYRAGYEILYVVTASEKQAGRGLKLKPSPVRLLAEKLGLKILEPENPNTEDVYQILSTEKVDVCTLAAYGFIIKPKLLSLPTKGFINVHPSLLPKYRGAAPIQRTIMNGEKVTGVTIFFMNEAMDAGDIILQSKTDIDDNETYDELQARLAQIGADLLIKSLNLIKDNNFKATPQDKSQVTLAPKIKKEHCLINWNRPAIEVHNLIRGLSMEPGAHTHFRDKRVKILKSTVTTSPPISDVTSQLNPGQILPAKKNLFVATQDGYLQILFLQMEGGKVITGTDFINGQRLQSVEYFK
jgi:methionyl-tRNA formyltransferase